METSPELFGQVIFGVLLALILVRVFDSIVSGYGATGQKRAITTAAFLNGLALEMSISPLGIAATEVAALDPWAPIFNTPALVSSLLVTATFLEICFGLTRLWSGSGVVGVVGFALAFGGGSIFIYNPVIGGSMAVLGGWGIEVTPNHQWTVARR